LYRNNLQRSSSNDFDATEVLIDLASELLVEKIQNQASFVRLLSKANKGDISL
jgi:hypothetical protein